MLQPSWFHNSFFALQDSHVDKDGISCSSEVMLPASSNEGKIDAESTAAVFPTSGSYQTGSNVPLMTYPSDYIEAGGSFEQATNSCFPPFDYRWPAFDSAHDIEASLPRTLKFETSSQDQGISMKALMDWLQMPEFPCHTTPATSCAHTTSHDQDSLSYLSPGSTYDHQASMDMLSPSLSIASPSLMQVARSTPAASDATFSDIVMSPRFLPEQATDTKAYTVTSDITLRGGKGSNLVDVPYPHYTTPTIPPSIVPTSSHTVGSNPTISDFKVVDAVDVPRKQLEKRRGGLDLYTPVWIRGEGMNREGWCRFCTPGSWLNLKTSQYLYHLQNAHGICQITGQVCTPPVQLRIFHDGSHITDGLCGTCHQWITIGTARRRRNFSSWFEHARKCHRKDRPRRVAMTTSSSTPSLLPASPSVQSSSSVVPLQEPLLIQHQRAQSCGIHQASSTGPTFCHKRGAESLCLLSDVKKPRQA